MNQTKKILIVEDDADLQEILKSRLEHDGFTVLQANNGKEGLDMALSAHPDLILLDIMMPLVSGFEMIKALRQDPWGKQVHVFMLTSVNRSKEMSEGMKYNVAKYIVKTDIKYQDLLWSIKSYLNMDA